MNLTAYYDILIILFQVYHTYYYLHIETNYEIKKHRRITSYFKSGSPKEFIDNNHNDLISEALSTHLTALLKEKGKTKAQVIKASELNDIYCYQIFSGKRFPSRDTLLSICIGMQLNVDETQQLLLFAGFAPLYVKNIRDSIILFGINHQYTIYEINESLYSNNENTLGQSC